MFVYSITSWVRVAPASVQGSSVCGSRSGVVGILRSLLETEGPYALMNILVRLLCILYKSKYLSALWAINPKLAGNWPHAGYTRGAFRVRL